MVIARQLGNANRGQVGPPPPSPGVAIEPEQQGFWATFRQEQREFWLQTRSEHLKFIATLIQDKLEFRATLGLTGPLPHPTPHSSPDHTLPAREERSRHATAQPSSGAPHAHDTRWPPPPSDHTGPRLQSHTSLQEPTDRPPVRGRVWAHGHIVPRKVKKLGN